MPQLWLLISADLSHRRRRSHPHSQARPYRWAQMVWICDCGGLRRRVVQARELHVRRLCGSCIEGSMPSVGRQICGMGCLPRHIVVGGGLHSWDFSRVLHPHFRCLGLQYRKEHKDKSVTVTKWLQSKGVS